ncbi:hypothetical protein Daus18300_014024 [Diaporthe australafricana]|uniref:C2H2-type domain-containing protein n=1 Tax=Diaporthe australafricana TaxID=127596 RepID=A0ABR3VWZ4_9PEZI
MPGQADGQRARGVGIAKKRDLDDALFAGARDAKRRHTTAQGHNDDESPLNKSKVDYGKQDITRNSAPTSSKTPSERLWFPSSFSSTPPPQGLLSPRLPNATGLAARTLGRLGGPAGPPTGRPGATGVFSGSVQRTTKRNPIPSGPPTSSSTSSDASSIPARSNETLPVALPQTHTSAFHSRYGLTPANRAAAADAGNQPQDIANVISGPKSRQPSAQKKNTVYPSLVKGEKTTDSSEDGLYTGDGDEETDDENASTITTTRRGSARLKEKARQDSPASRNETFGYVFYRKTPSGKDYSNCTDEHGNVFFSEFVLFPDGYCAKRRFVGFPGGSFSCPVRTCQQRFNKLRKLNKHFKLDHKRSEFNDNLDQDGTLEYVRPRTDTEPGDTSIIVSQDPRYPPGLAPRPPTVQPTKKHDPRKAAADENAIIDTCAVPVSKASKKVLKSQSVVDLFSSEDDEQDNTSATSFELNVAMTESDVWAYVASLVPKTYTACLQDNLEIKAFIQAISLPQRHTVDKEWLEGTLKSHQKRYRSLMSVVVQVVGVKAQCKPCESKVPERKRNCKILPPEAEGMQELQEVCGSQCANCYFFQASAPCEFPTSSTMMKQTPVPVPPPSVMRPPPKVERLAPPPASRAPPASTRSQPPSYSSYKATLADKPISESPVPIPVLGAKGPDPQLQALHTSDVDSEKAEAASLRRSRRILKQDSGSGSNVVDDDSDPFESLSASSAASDAMPSENALMSTASGTKPSTVATPMVSTDEVSSAQLVGKAFSLFSEIGQLPPEEQATLWQNMQQMAGMLQTGMGAVPKAPSAYSSSASLPPVPSAAADEWEIAPGKLTVDDRRLAFSTSFLSRESVSLKAAQQLSMTQRVLNKSIKALHQLILVPEKGWDCTVSVVKGLLKMKVGDVEARIGQGGVVVVERECIITNVLHKEAVIQVWWTDS